MSGNVSPSALLEECNRRANKRKRGEIEDDHLDQHPFSIRVRSPQALNQVLQTAIDISSRMPTILSPARSAFTPSA